VFIVVYFAIDSVRKLLDTPLYITKTEKDWDLLQDGPVLQSGTTPHDNDTATGHEPQRCSMPRRTDWL